MKKIFLIGASLVLLAACNKKLDIEPTQSVSETDVFTSDANVKKALNGAYDAASNGYVFGGDMMLYSELLASEAAGGELRWDGTFNQPREVFNKSILTNNSYVTGTWTNAYDAINICNNILANLSVVNESDRAQVEGEALFLRGSLYFNMVELFAKPYSAGNVTTALGLPIITTPTVGNVTEVNYVPRSTLQQTYDLIIADLTKAKAQLSGDRSIYATTWAAAGMLSRVYLQTADYQKAAEEANYVISESDLFLVDYEAAFNNTENSDEDLFAIQVSSQDGANDMQLFWSIREYGARSGDVDVLQKHLNLYPGQADDARFNLFYKDGSVWRSGKWKFQYRNLSMLRLAEMYLTRAEANFRLNPDPNASAVGDASPLDDITAIRERAGYATTTEAYITLDNIILERKLELAHEGQAIQDIKRLKRSIGSIPYDDNSLVFPIPIREINAVGASTLVQNDGYN